MLELDLMFLHRLRFLEQLFVEASNWKYKKMLVKRGARK